MVKVTKQLTNTRRIFLRATLKSSVIVIVIKAGLLKPRVALAAWPKAAFEAKNFNDIITSLHPGELKREPGTKVSIKSPDLAENGAVVPITVQVHLPTVDGISLLVQENSTPLAAHFAFSVMAKPFVSTRLKIGKTSPVIAVAVSNGIAYISERTVKIGIGGEGDGHPVKLIALFPWPVPTPSAMTIINRNLVVKKTGITTLSDVAERLSDALHRSGYVRKSYYYLDTPIKNGFVLVTRIERINEKGKPLDPRWTTNYEVPPIYSTEDIIRILFTSTPGHFRVIAFVVSPYNLTTKGVSPTEKQADKWLDEGLDRLPKDLRNIQFTEEYSCRALIYEFSKDKSGKSSFVPRGDTRLTADDHLNGAMVYANLEK